MAISAAATETIAIALVAECRRCLSIGVDLKPFYIKQVIDQLESATVNNLSGRTDIVPDTAQDGRTPGEVTVIT